MPEIMIFKAGKYPQGDWPKERVQRMVDAYDPDKGFEAAVVIGHRFYADTDEAQYAHGWVKSLRMDGAGKVYADIPEFSADAKKAIAEKKLRYVSAEIYEFDKLDPDQPPYLRAVALLGRDTPAIPAARLPSLFGFDGGVVSIVDKEQHVAAFTRKVSAEEMIALSSGGRQEEKANPQEEDMGDVEKLQAELAKSNEQLAAFRRENEELKSAAVANALVIAAGHVFVILIRNAYPINVLSRIKECFEVCNIYCATANPVEVVLAESEQGRGILGVIDGVKTKGIEGDADVAWRKEFLRKIGYKL